MKYQKINQFFLFFLFQQSFCEKEKLINDFFQNTKKICFINHFDYEFSVSKIHQSEVWDLTEMKENSCLNIENFLITTKYPDDLFKEMKEKRNFPASSRILIVTQKQPEINFHDLALEKNWNIFFLSEIFENSTDVKGLTERFQGKTQKYSVYSVLKRKFIKNVTSIKNYNWNPIKVLNKLNETLRIIGFSCPNFVVLENGVPAGIEVEILEEITRGLPKTYRVLPQENVSNDFPWGYLIDEIERGNSDLGISAFWLGNVNDSTIPFYQQCLTYIVKRPTLYSEKTFMFQSLSLTVWGTLILFTCFMILLLIGLSLLLKYLNIGNYQVQPIYLIGHLGGVSAPELPPVSVPILRYLMLFWVIFCLIMTTTYNAGLINSLNFPMLTKDIKTFEDMVAEGVKWVNKYKYTYYHLTTVNDTISNQLVELFDYFDGDEIMNNIKLKNENYGLPVVRVQGGYIEYLRFINKSLVKNFQVIPECLFTAHVIMPLQKHSPYKEYIDRQIFFSIQHGLMDYLQRKYFLRKKTKEMQELSYGNFYERRQILDLPKMQGVFVLLIFGLSLAIGVFCYELIRGRRSSSLVRENSTN